MMDFATTYLQSFVNYENNPLPTSSSAFHLRRMHALLELLGNPQDKYFVIHVVGTKGKGSTAIFIASILREAGLRVGLYTSPHLYDVKERIRVLTPRRQDARRKNSFEGKISAREFPKLLKAMQPAICTVQAKKFSGQMTFFEVLTAAAFYFFAQEKIDVAVVEAGLGGRLDATNTTRSDICVLTSMSLEHTAQLGKTLSRIAFEKSSVIKESTCAVFSAPQARAAASVIRQAAKKNHAALFQTGQDIHCKILKQDPSRMRFSVKIQNAPAITLCSPLLGAYQAVNASLAAGVARYFLHKRKMASRQAIAQGVAKAFWPARCEVVRRFPFIVVDSAHTEDSIRKFLEAIQSLFPRRKLYVIFGASKDKNIQGMLKILAPHAHAICLTQSRHPRAFDFLSGNKAVASFLERKEIFSIESGCQQALACFLKKAKRQDIILATGSIFIASEIRRLCLQKA